MVRLCPREVQVDKPGELRGFLVFRVAGFAATIAVKEVRKHKQKKRALKEQEAALASAKNNTLNRTVSPSIYSQTNYSGETLEVSHDPDSKTTIHSPEAEHPSQRQYFAGSSVSQQHAPAYSR